MPARKRNQSETYEEYRENLEKETASLDHYRSGFVSLLPKNPSSSRRRRKKVLITLDSMRKAGFTKPLKREEKLVG